MKTRMKNWEINSKEQGKIKIQASFDEIMNDFYLINKEIPRISGEYMDEENGKGNFKVYRKKKRKITEDISPILGLASFINEMGALGGIDAKDIGEISKKNNRKAPINCTESTKTTRAGTHVGICQYIIKMSNIKHI